MKAYRIDVQGELTPASFHVGADDGVSLADLLHQNGLPLNTRCGQRGLCDSCIVEVLHGTVEQHQRKQRLTARAPVQLRACDYRPASDLIIHVPNRAIRSQLPGILDDFDIRITAARDPLVAAKWGVAIDVGTTTVALLLVDLASGEVSARASSFNAQMRLGDDVVTRITRCMDDSAMLKQMQSAILHETIGPLLQQAANRAGAAMKDIGAIVIAGNTTMLHLLSGEDPTSLGTAPFTPRFTEHRVVRAGDLLADWEPAIAHVPIHLLPGAAAYIGADIVAGLVATGMVYEPQTTLLVDVGTNGEIVLKHADQLIACAAAAGPAFEGARLTSGMLAGQGAITDIQLDVATGAHTLRWRGREDRVAPIGLCGSAYIDFLAEARRQRLLSSTGRFNRAVSRPCDWQQNGNGAPGYRVATAQNAAPIVVSECDIASLLTAKAAIAAGIRLLLDRLGLKPGDVKHVYLAGGFGTHMNAANAIAIGLLPGFTVNQIIPVGNSALAGAYLALMDRSLLADLRRVASEIEPIELNLIPEFQDTYIDMLQLR